MSCTPVNVDIELHAGKNFQVAYLCLHYTVLVNNNAPLPYPSLFRAKTNVF